MRYVQFLGTMAVKVLLTCTIIISLTCGYLLSWGAVTLFAMLFFLLVGCILGENLLGTDLADPNSRMSRRWSKAGVFWQPYRWLVSKWEPLKALPFLSTATRVFFLFALLSLLSLPFAFARMTGPLDWVIWLIQAYPQYAGILYLGVELVSTAAIVTVWLHSRIRLPRGAEEPQEPQEPQEPELLAEEEHPPATHSESPPAAESPPEEPWVEPAESNWIFDALREIEQKEKGHSAGQAPPVDDPQSVWADVEAESQDYQRQSAGGFTASSIHDYFSNYNVLIRHVLRLTDDPIDPNGFCLTCDSGHPELVNYPYDRELHRNFCPVPTLRGLVAPITRCPGMVRIQYHHEWTESGN